MLINVYGFHYLNLKQDFGFINVQWKSTFTQNALENNFGILLFFAQIVRGSTE